MKEAAQPSVALCLAGGGLSGALFEFGAVAALDAGLAGWDHRRTVLTVGTSSGAVVAAFLALGADPGGVLEAARNPRHPYAIHPRHLSRVPWARHAAGAGRALRALPGAVRRNLAGPGPFWGGLADDLSLSFPSGMFSNDGIERWVGQVARHHGRRDSLAEAGGRLLITATDLDTGDRVVLSAQTHPGLALSRAVMASSAVPAYFSPVTIGEHDLIDGQISDPLHVDLCGTEATVVIAVSPLVPYRRAAGLDNGARVRRAGMGAVYDQSARISAEVKHRRSWAAQREAAPGQHAFLIAPDPRDVPALFHTGRGMGSRERAWKMGFSAAAAFLRAEDAALARAGLVVDEDALAEARVRLSLDDG